ncbi:MAG TPA: hypothetical protein VIV12_09530 [Streptosporangiaceae bacterium]
MTLPVMWRAVAAQWRPRLATVRQRARRDRHVLTSLVLVVLGLGGALGGAALVGEHFLGLTVIAESAGVLWFGLMRDDGAQRVPDGHTVADVLERARRAG